MTRGMRLRAALSQAGCGHRSEMVHPTPNCLVRRRHSAFRQRILDLAHAESEPEVEPYGLANDLGWGTRSEPVSRILDFPRSNRLSCSSKFGNRVRA